MKEKDRPYRRKRVWVNPGFQTRYTLIIVVVAASLLAVLGTLYVRALYEQTTLMGVLSNMTPPAPDDEFNKDLREKVKKSEDLPRVVALIGTAALLVFVLAFVGVRVTFKAAGPVYAASRMLRAMAMGQFRAIRPLRKGDEFRFLSEDLAALRDFLKQEAQNDIALLERAIETITSMPLSGTAERAVVLELVEDLREAVRIKRERFGEGK